MGKFSDFTFSGASFKRTLLSFFIILSFFIVSAESPEEKNVSADEPEKPAENIVENKGKTAENTDKIANNAAPSVYTKNEFIEKFIQKAGMYHAFSTQFVNGGFTLHPPPTAARKGAERLLIDEIAPAPYALSDQESE